MHGEEEFALAYSVVEFAKHYAISNCPCSFACAWIWTFGGDEHTFVGGARNFCWFFSSNFVTVTEPADT